jgi:hypothetical protein
MLGNVVLKEAEDAGRRFCIRILNYLGKRLAPLFLLIVVTASTAIPASAASQQSNASQYFRLALEATDWTTSFQITPITSSSGIPYQDDHAWGLDPYYYTNGTITAGEAGIVAGEKQELALLIGGHDAGLGASAALNAYLQTGDTRYLDVFRIYLDYFKRSQIPSPSVETQAKATVKVADRNVALDYSGYWAEQANVQAGLDGVYGTGDDRTDLLAIYPAAEHGNPIALALIAYYRLTRDADALRMLDKYGSWLVNLQIKTGEFAGAFPVTQYYWALGWKPRMYETTESAWVLSELYLLTRNDTYVKAATAAGNYMLSKQFTEQSDPVVRGALPYEWNKTKYTNIVLTNHAGFTILAWTQLFRVTNDTRYLFAAEKYATWLMSFQVTTPDTNWGNHTYSNDSLAVGGFYYGYDPDKHEFGWRVALSLWSAAYAIPGLLRMYELTKDERYLDSALLAADWLTRMRYPDKSFIPLQSLAVIKYVLSSWWGPYPQFYQPDMRQIDKAGIPDFVKKGEANVASIRDANLTWYERTFGVDFNEIDYQMASRGTQYMKMIWSWWPDIGFEPRYGGDIAFGAFTIANFLTFGEKLRDAQLTLSELNQLYDQIHEVQTNVARQIRQAQVLVQDGVRDFNEGWYPTAVAKISNASRLAQDALKQLNALVPLYDLTRIQQIETYLVVMLLAAIAITNIYWHRRLRQLSPRKRTAS